MALRSTEVEVRRGSILAIAPGVDGVVSSDDNYLSHGGGVSAALWRAAGDLDLTRLSLPAALGDVLETSAGRLGCKRIHHAITIDLDSGQRADGSRVRELVERTLARAAEAGDASVAFPLLAAGAGRLSPEASALAIVEGIAVAAEWLVGMPRRVVLVVVDRDDPDVVDRAVRTSPAMPSVLDAGLAALERQLAIEHRRPQPAGPEDEALERWERVIGACMAIAARAGASLDLGSTHLRAQFLIKRSELLDPSHPQRAAGLLEEALRDRNQLAHGIEGPRDRAARVVSLRRKLVGLVELLPAATREHESPSVSLGADASPVVAGIVGTGIVGTLTDLWRLHARSTPARPAPVEPRSPLRYSAAASPSGPDNEPVRELARLAASAFDPDDLDRLDEALVVRGYRGSREDRLLEHCVRVTSPARWLANNLTASALLAELRLRGIDTSRLPDDTDSSELASQLLFSIGFPPIAVPRGLRQARDRLEHARSRAHGVDALELRGLVVASGAELEHLALVLLRFVSLVAFKQPPELLLTKDDRTPLTKRGLGNLFSLLGALSKRLGHDDQAAAFRSDFAFASLLPERFDTSDLARRRNVFAHAGREDELDEGTLRSTAVGFFDRGLEFVTFLEGAEGRPRIFPRVVVPRRIVLDAWGRRIVEADSDEGVTEFLFTDHTLRPGHVYYMHAFTNPFRIDPILVPADEMTQGVAGRVPA
ncbi:MAG: hypothetical protein OHK0013_01560 [Sandaracinaceae bacterium]